MNKFVLVFLLICFMVPPISSSAQQVDNKPTNENIERLLNDVHQLSNNFKKIPEVVNNIGASDHYIEQTLQPLISLKKHFRSDSQIVRTIKQHEQSIGELRDRVRSDESNLGSRPYQILTEKLEERHQKLTDLLKRIDRLNNELDDNIDELKSISLFLKYQSAISQFGDDEDYKQSVIEVLQLSLAKFEKTLKAASVLADNLANQNAISN